MTIRRHSALLLSVLVAVLAACSDHNPVAQNEPTFEHQGLAPLYLAPDNGVEGSYIVVLKSGAGSFSTSTPSGINPSLAEVDPAAPAKAVAAEVGATPELVFDAALSGFAAPLNQDQLMELRRDPDVAYIEQDQVIRAQGTTQKMDSYGDPWGLDRIDQRSRSLSKTYSYNNTGEGVTVYLIDTGIQTSHSQFEGRAKNVFDSLGGNGSDCHGHGTAAAGTIGGKTYGVAKDVRLRGLRILDCKAQGYVSHAIKALDWVRKNHRDPAVTNLSFYANKTSALNDAVNKLVSAGIFVSIPAGNEGKDACNSSPASASGAFVVAASTKTDYRVSYSNYGSCVDIYAPGYKIWTAKRNGDAQYWNGTCLASAHVAGVAALYKERYPSASPGSVSKWLKNNATSGTIRSNKSGTPNLLLYKANL